jgi:hypothetical protein
MHQQVENLTTVRSAHIAFMFCIYLRTNNDLYHLNPQLVSFYNRDEKCLQRGTEWVFKYSSLRFVCKRLRNKMRGTRVCSIIFVAQCSSVGQLQKNCTSRKTERNHILRFLFVRDFRAIPTGRWIGRRVKQNYHRQVPILFCVVFPWNSAKQEVYRSKPRTLDEL